MSGMTLTLQSCDQRGRKTFGARAWGPKSRRRRHLTKRRIPSTEAGLFKCGAAVDAETAAAGHSDEIRSALTAIGGTVLFLLMILLGYQNVALKERLVLSDARVSDIATRLISHRQEALSREDLGSVQIRVEDQLRAALLRVSTLEQRSIATSRVIGSALPSIMFLQVAYRFEDGDTGRPLRYLVGSDGEPLMTPAGPAMSLKGTGPVVERQLTGTAFVATEDRILITNRHVVRPWEQDEAAKILTSRGLVPVMYRLVGYLPRKAEPLDVEVISMSDDADVAILKSDELPPDVPYLELSTLKPGPGEPVIVMGYPTGMQALLARADHGFVDELQKTPDIDFWRVARELSNSRHINPLASQGIVGQISTTFVVYDAETAQGGSGGPVLGVDGRVVAINTAIIPGFNGSNLGVPVNRVRPLLDALAENH